jgi:eukaryotic-like serine/threonine-protein kinase
MEHAMTTRVEALIGAAESAVNSNDKVSSVGKYKLFAGIGSGGMAEVFLGVAQGPMGFNKLVVVKRLRANLVDEDENFAHMFLDEARLAARLNHPNIVHTYEVGAHAGSLFIAMEFLEGQPLRRVRDHALRSGQPMPIHLAVRMVADALAGLHYAHELKDYDGTPLGIVLRDVSPHNIFVTYDGTVKMVDFGIAKATVNSTQTAFGTFKGKPGYMAPEQATAKDQDCRADIFAMGIILWELVTGSRLFPGDTVQALTSLISAAIPKASEVRPEVDAELAAIIDKALQRKPDQRYVTAEKMRHALLGWLRTHAPAPDAPDVASYVSEMFKDIRESIRKRIEVHMAATQNPRASLSDQSMTGMLMIGGVTTSGIAETIQPPTIDLGSASGRSNVLSTALSNVAETQKKSSPLHFGALGAGILCLVGALVLYGRPRDEARPATVGPAPAPIASVTAPPPAPEATQAKTHGTFVTLVSDPQGATVQYNGRSIGITPATVELPAGPQTLVLSKEGCTPVELGVDVPLSSDQPLLRTIKLKSVARASAPPARVPRTGPTPPASAPAEVALPAAPPATIAAAPPATQEAPKAPMVKVIEDARTKVRSLD